MAWCPQQTWDPSTIKLLSYIGEYAAPASAFVEGNGRVRCGVAMGYGGGSSAANQQPSLSTTNGFASYGLVDSNGVTLQSDQLPVVGK